MRRKSNKIQFIALAFIMLFSVMNAWGNVNMSVNMFHKWNGVGRDASYLTNDGGNAIASGAVFNIVGDKNAGDTFAGTSSVLKDVYADLMGYSAIYIEGTANRWVRFVFNRWSDSDNDIVVFERQIDNNGKLTLDLRDLKDANGKQLKFWHLNAIKSSWSNGNNKLRITRLELVESTSVGFWTKDDPMNTQFSLTYSVSNNRQREFTFKNSKSKNIAENSCSWALWVVQGERTNPKRIDYFFLDLAPSMRSYDAEKGTMGAPETTDVYIVKSVNGENELEPLLTDEQWKQFRDDMFDYNEVSVKIANYDGVVTVYSVMKDKNKARTYVYACEYQKHDGKSEKIDVFFTADRTILTDFSAKSEVLIYDIVPGGVEYPNGTDNNDKTCSAIITTKEGYVLEEGSKAGKGDVVVTKAIPGRKWVFEKWKWNNYTQNLREITVGDRIAPIAIFKRDQNANIFNPATDRIFFLDFEDKGNKDLITVIDDKTPEGVELPASINREEGKDTQFKGKFYNYGGKGRILEDPVFGKYYQNLAVGVNEVNDGTNEMKESKAENFLRIVLDDDQQFNLGYIYYAPKNGGWEVKKNKSATIGFWVNASIANRYELPLERGSMFCMFSDLKFKKAIVRDDGTVNENDKPRFMFDLACNGWIYSYMPNNDDKTKQYKNFYYYGDSAPVTATPTESLFGKYYPNAQNQLLPKFYDDSQWHYVTYVADNDLTTVTLYVDGNKCLTKDLSEMGKEKGKDFFDFEEGGDYPSRVTYLRNLVLGGFTPHGLFFDTQYYSDAALAYDEIAIYSRALSQEEIEDIVVGRKTNKYEWHFTEALKAEGNLGSGTSYNKNLGGAVQVLKDANNHEIAATEGLKFSGNVVIDKENGLLGLKRGARVYITGVPWKYNIRFVAKRMDGTVYAQDNLFPKNNRYFKGGVVKCIDPGKEDFYIDVSNRCRQYENDMETYFNARADVWISDIVITPYDMNFSYNKTRVDDVGRGNENYRRYQECREVELLVDHSQTDGNGKLVIKYKNRTGNEHNSGTWETNWQSAPSLPTFNYYYKCEPATPNYTVSNSNPYVKLSSSSAQIAYIEDNQVKLTGLPGSATIKAVLVQHNLQDSLIFASYKIVVTDAVNTNRLVANSNVSVGTVHTTANTNSNVIVTTGGWAYNGGSYASGSKNVTDGWGTASYNYSAANDPNPVDGFAVVAQGQQDAHSESYGLNGGSGRFSPAASATDGLNQKPWTLPCRGAYIKVQPQKAGVLSVYVLQNGNLGDEVGEGDAKHCTTVSWRPVYVADETGRVLTDIYVTSNSKISQKDNFFREGRRRAQFIETETKTWNEQLEKSLSIMLKNYPKRFKTLIENWSNAGWKQRIIPSGDGGHMVMSKGIVRYTFNVYPGKTYYIFSNDTKVGYSGYNFEEGKHLKKSGSGVYSLTSVSSTPKTVTFEDAINGATVNGNVYNQPSFPYDNVTEVTYNRTFTPGNWGSICLPFSMNNKQMKENFGDETSVVLLKGIDDKGVVQMVWHVNQDIIAGYPYFILPRGKESITQIKTNAYFDPKVKAPSFVIGPEMDNGQSATYGSIELLEKAVGKTEYPYVFKGNFDTEQATAGSYVMTTSGILTKASNTPNIKPFRAYLRYCSQIDANSGDHANGKPLTGMGYMNSDGEEVTTSIEQILEANGIFVDSANVYGIDGQVKRYNTHDLNGLPKGIYIVNGKKYVVK